MSLKNKFLLFAATFLILISTGAMTSFKNHKFMESFFEEMGSIITLQSQCNTIKDNIEHMLMIPHDYLIHRAPEEKENFSRSFNSLKQNIQKFKQLLLFYSERKTSSISKSLLDSHQRISTLKKELLEFEEFVISGIFTSNQHSNQNAWNTMEKMDLLAHNLKTKITQENHSLIALKNKELNTLNRREHTLYIKVQILESCFLIIGFFMTLYLYHCIIVPLNNLVHVTREISTGNMSSRVEIKSTDEFGELGRSFNSMLHKLSIISERMNSIFKDQEKPCGSLIKNLLFFR